MEEGIVSTTYSMYVLTSNAIKPFQINLQQHISLHRLASQITPTPTCTRPPLAPAATVTARISSRGRAHPRSSNLYLPRLQQQQPLPPPSLPLVTCLHRLLLLRRRRPKTNICIIITASKSLPFPRTRPCLRRQERSNRNPTPSSKGRSMMMRARAISRVDIMSTTITILARTTSCKGGGRRRKKSHHQRGRRIRLRQLVTCCPGYRLGCKK